METDWSETTLPLFGLEANNYLRVLKQREKYVTSDGKGGLKTMLARQLSEDRPKRTTRKKIKSLKSQRRHVKKKNQ